MNTNSEVWIAEDDRSLRWVMEKAIERDGKAVKSFESGGALLSALRFSKPEIIISDIKMPGIDGLELLANIHENYPDIPVIITTAHSDLDSAVAAYQGGAFEYLPKPFDLEELVDVARRAESFSSELKSDRDVEEVAFVSQEIIGEAPAMQEVFRAIGRLSNSNITVLINGESGTGKELVAQALHKHSPRKEAKFIALNMAAIPRDLIESELFGHEKGAFTGASAARTGLVEAADGGTLFLDEVGELSPDLQLQLLRLVQEGEFRRVGETRSRRANVRLMTATHRNLREMVRQGDFREDLFYRLNVVPLYMPPLRRRGSDVPLLIVHFCHSFRGVSRRFSREEMRALMVYKWPGNVRELQNEVARLLVMSDGDTIDMMDLPVRISQYFLNHLSQSEKILNQKAILIDAANYSS